MNNIRRKAVLALSLTCVVALAAAAQAQYVTAKISTREAYVGLPVVLQVQITNAENYQLPDIPEIDGCQVHLREVHTLRSLTAIAPRAAA